MRSVKSVISLADTAAIRKDTVTWESTIEFLLTCVSYAVGLGNVWRFPYLCFKNGGGAFLIPYCTMCALIGMPIFFAELSLGQFASLGPLMIWTVNPLMKGLGYAMVSVTFLVTLYYNVIIAQCLFYLVHSIIGSFGDGMPWSSCEGGYNTHDCFVPSVIVHHNVTSEIEAEVLNGTDDCIIPMNYTKDGVMGFVGTSTEEFYL